MSRGAIVTSECLASYNNLVNGAYPNITYKISDDHTEIHVEREGYVSSYENFLGYLPTDECRFAVFDFFRRVFLFIDWCPEDADIKDKNTYAASKDALINALQGIDI
ncbi:cofilin, partial [Haplosporangium bisporale]